LKLLIFDWDGTLIDSADRIINCMQQASQDCQLPVPSREAIREIIGLALPQVFDRLYGGLDQPLATRMRQRYSYYYLEQDQTPAELFPGVRDGLQRLREEGYQLAVATGKSRNGLDQVFAETGLGELFDYSRCADESRSKPDPLMLEQLLAQSGVARDRALMVGDTEYDLEMAANAQIVSIGVSYGAHPVERLHQHGPEQIIDHFFELEHWLDGLSS
jgi:phosphoglycolate phosphatase